EQAKLPARIMIDASHANSSKQPENQTRVADDIAAQIAGGARRIGAGEVESHLVGGRQDLVPGKPLVYGQSITDGCIGWDMSVDLLADLPKALPERRKAAVAAWD